uniref:Uncharacterized protein n=1 Tax=Lepeophtheirus salmonis TaxID=72036 RepID=A0A0K2TJ11_LEPSM
MRKNSIKPSNLTRGKIYGWQKVTRIMKARLWLLVLLVARVNLCHPSFSKQALMINTKVCNSFLRTKVFSWIFSIMKDQL